MNYLERAENNVEMAFITEDEQHAQLCAQTAIAHALIALVEEVRDLRASIDFVPVNLAQAMDKYGVG